MEEDNIKKVLVKPLVFKTPTGFEFCSHKEIVRMEACGNNTKIFLSHDARSTKVLCNLKKTHCIVNKPEFVRCHRSHIINLKFIRRFDIYAKNVTMFDGSIVPVSKEFRRVLVKFSDKLSSNYNY